MATLRTGIELQDNFSNVLYGIIGTVNLSISAMEEMRQSIGADISTAELEGAREEINQVTMAVNRMASAMNGVEAAPVDVPAAVRTQSVQQTVSVPAVTGTPVIQQPVRMPAQQPVEIPVKWQTDNMPVFTGSGIERFTQEIENANLMIDQLYDTQTAIVQQAGSINIFSPEAQQDLSQIASRIEMIRTQIERMESNPVNIGSDAANAGMERLRSQLNSALKEQQALNRAVDSMDVESANEAYLQLSGTIADTERYIRDNVDAQGQFNQAIDQGQTKANGLEQTLKRMVATYVSIQSLQKVIGLSDELASARAKLDMMNDGVRTTGELQNMIYQSAERSRGSYLDMVNSVAKLGNLAKDAFGSTEEVVAFSEQLNKQFIIAGASTSEIQNATLQLTQALASGVLRGDELNSIFEQAPTIIQSIADYMNVPIGQIRELASEGKITADIVKNAMFAAADDTNAKFESMPKTFEQIGQSIQNTAIMAFEPVLTRLNEIANSQEFEEFIDSLCQGIAFLGSVAVEVFDLLVKAGSFVADSWWILGPIIYGVAAALLLYTAALKGYNAVQKISNLLRAVAEIREKAHAASLALESKATFMATASQYGFNAALLACPITWIIIAIIALIAILTAVIIKMNQFSDESVSAVEKVCGAFAVAGAFIGNVFISAINLIIEKFVTLWNFVALFANFLANVFTDPIGAIARLFFGFIDMALAGLQALANVIDTLFGSSLAESVEGWRSNLDNWVTEKFGTGEVVMEKKNAQDYYLNGIDYGEAWDKGAAFGSKFSNAGTGMLDGQYEDFDYSSYLTDISDDTEDIKDGLGITEEDLKYLRDIAEQETINRFTTAAITIEQTNHNSISSEMDLDGVISGLTDAVDEAAGMIAEGVHV